jgi:hypothetical protein
MTDEELAEQRKAKSRERRSKLRREKGIRTRADYLAQLWGRPRPWEAEGIHRRTWERRRARVVAESVPTPQQLPQGSDATIVLRSKTDLATPEQGESQASQQGRGEAERLRETAEVGKVESQKTGTLA